ncbi:MAG: hypothetical protein QM737_23400 [Ferruginibacter sp.]
MKTKRTVIRIVLIYSLILFISCTDDTSHTPVGVDTVPPKLDNIQPTIDTAKLIDSTYIK